MTENKKNPFTVSLLNSFETERNNKLVKSDDNIIEYEIKEYKLEDLNKEFKKIKEADKTRLFFYNIEKNLENLILENKDDTKKLLIILWNLEITKKIIDYFIENYYNEMLKIKNLLYNYKGIRIDDEDFTFFFIEFLYSYIKIFIRNAFIKLIKKGYKFDNFIYLLLYSSFRQNKKDKKINVESIIFETKSSDEKIEEIIKEIKKKKNYTFGFLNNFVKNYLIKIKKEQEKEKNEYTFSELWIEHYI